MMVLPISKVCSDVELRICILKMLHSFYHSAQVSSEFIPDSPVMMTVNLEVGQIIQ